MWRSIKPLTSLQLRQFETTFQFNIQQDMREFLLTHNAGIPSSAIFPTKSKEWNMVRLLDFSDSHSTKGAWAINKRLKDKVGDKRIIIGIDRIGNYICLERHYRHQDVVVWVHHTEQFEPSLLDIPTLLRCIS